jgi:Zn-dependent protease
MGFSADALRDMPLWVIAFLISGSLHEFAHAWAATKLGDPTPEQNGRLTINPIPHIDPFGLIFIIFMTLSGWGIGWMKPVPVNYYNFRNPRQGMLLTAIAGPISNLIQVVFLVSIFKLMPFLFMEGNPLGRLLIIFLELNVLLGVFNLLPIPPLDGSHVLEGLLPEALAEQYDKIRPYGFFILLALLFTGVLDKILSPIFHFVFNFIIGG